MTFTRHFASLVLAAWLAICPLSAFANDRAVSNDLKSWSIVTLQIPINEKFKTYFEVQPRLGNNLQEMDQLIVRPAIGYQVNKHVLLSQGYAWIPMFDVSRTRDGFYDEHRIYQEALLTHSLKDIRLTHRTRLEERFIDGAGDTAVRGRHLTRLSIPLGDSDKWSWELYNEIFVNLNTTESGPRAGFDQNRVFTGLRRKFNDTVQAELGYLNQYLNADGPTDRLNHAIMLGVYLTP